ncbi:hypothetical protein DSM05_02555 [Pseudomonas sp. FW305-3-2-15-E-TSA4]|nr:hypothetical protein [Pseudomonas sp. FW305-3-2-15-E-TSA4]
MTDAPVNNAHPAEAAAAAPEDEDLIAVFGEDLATVPEPMPADAAGFAPWHHPVKQVVRQKQWVSQVEVYLRDHVEQPRTLRYFTLPGPDMLDVRALATVCAPAGHKIEYFGFDSSGSDADSPQSAKRFKTEAALRQADVITDNIMVHPDRLEDIAVPGSHTAEKLKSQAAFDIVNIDGCDHLAFTPKGRQVTTYHALKVLLAHQAKRDEPWLLWITTRATPADLGDPMGDFQAAIRSNTQQSEEFIGAIVETLGLTRNTYVAEMTELWSARDERFLKLFTIGLSKYLLQLLHEQPNHPANVELKSAYAYRVFADSPDMLAIAYKITPGPRRLLEPGQAHQRQPLEVAHAVRVAERTRRLWNIDQAIQEDAELLELAVDGTVSLLAAADYDVEAWRQWVRDHHVRPLAI